ncbi:MAG: zinc-binding dehydrogenase [Bacteroidota bacterium]
MQAYVIHQAGGPEVLKLEELPDPRPSEGQVLIGIKAFGLNRAEAVTRMGGSGDAVKWPKVIGIECVGVVLECPGGELAVGQTVAAAMGGMGRVYNGSYAEKTLVPVSNVFPLTTSLDWVTLASVPETYFTAWGCLFESLQTQQHAKPRVVVRPAASALGIAITQIVNQLGGEVIGLTRSPDKVDRLKQAGMTEVWVTSDPIHEKVLQCWPEGATGVVDTVVSLVTVPDDVAMLAPNGRVCLAGSLAESYGTAAPQDFREALEKSAVGYFSSEELHVSKDGTNLQMMVDRMENGQYAPHIDTVYDFEELPAAHAAMDANQFAGKVVVKVAD